MTTRYRRHRRASRVGAPPAALLIAAIALLLAATAGCDRDDDAAEWKLVWEDTFDGDAWGSEGDNAWFRDWVSLPVALSGEMFVVDDMMIMAVDPDGIERL